MEAKYSTFGAIAVILVALFISGCAKQASNQDIFISRGYVNEFCFDEIGKSNSAICVDNMAIYPNGTIMEEIIGLGNSSQKGGKISQEQHSNLIKLFYDNGFFDLNESYDCMEEDIIKTYALENATMNKTVRGCQLPSQIAPIEAELVKIKATLT
jgi:hypothetical protein